jgi:hypothetical protein
VTRSLGLVVVLLLSACRKDAPAPAAVDAGPADAGQGAWAVVLFSPETRAEAEAALPGLSEAASHWVVAAPGYPRIVPSSTVPGFKPGYHVLLLGFCDSKERAAEVTGWVRLEATKAYFKQVEPGPESCPALPGKASAMTHAEALLATVPVDVDAGTRLTVVAGDPQRVMECRVRSTAVQLRRGPELLDEVAFAGECHGACTPKQKAEGEAQVKRIEAAIAHGEATESELDYNFSACLGVEVAHVEHHDELGPIAWVYAQHLGPHDVTTTRLHLVGPGCGDRLADVEVELPDLGLAEPVLRPNKASRFTRFELTDATNLDGTAAVVSRDDAGCSWRVDERR